MAKNEYDDLDELLDDLSNEITNSMLNGSVNKSVKEVYGDNVQKMYDSYEPSSYMRRGYWNNGFGDEREWQDSVAVNGNSLEYELTNEAKPMYDKRNRLDEIIEEGIYDYNTGIGKRPVYEWAQEQLDSSDIVEKALERDLKEWL